MKQTVGLPFALLAFFLLFLTPCYGRLGDTVNECTNRFGNATWEGTRSAIQQPGSYFAEFKKDGFRIKIAFLDGMVANERFYKDGKGEISADELATLLKADAGKMTWMKNSNGTYTRDDEAQAIFYGYSLSISTKKYLDLLGNFGSGDGKLRSF